MATPQEDEGLEAQLMELFVRSEQFGQHFLTASSKEEFAMAIKEGALDHQQAAHEAMKLVKAHSEKVALHELLDMDAQRTANIASGMSENDADNLATSRMVQRIYQLQAQLTNQVIPQKVAHKHDINLQKGDSLDERPDVPYELVDKLATHVSNTRTENVQLDRSEEGASDIGVTRKVGSANNAHTTIEKVLSMVYWYGFLEGRDEMVASKDEAMSEGDAFATIKQLVLDEVIGEDEMRTENRTNADNTRFVRNLLRGRQRQTLEKVMGVPQ